MVLMVQLPQLPNQEKHRQAKATEQPFELPLKHRVSFLQRLKGGSDFLMDAEHCLVNHEKIDYESMVGVSLENNRVILYGANASKHILNCGAKAEPYFNLINQCFNEAQAYLKAINLDSSQELKLSFARAKEMLKQRTIPYVRGVNVILKAAIAYGLSDLHFEPQGNELVHLTGRSAGKIIKILDFSKKDYERMASRLKYLAGCLSHISDLAQEGAFEFDGFNVRLSSFPTDHGERLSMRFIGSFGFLSLKALGWLDSWIEAWLAFTEGERGLYIISGSVGSGKTTAMYATLVELVNRAEHLRVVTIEDPVEAFIAGICQSSLHSMQEKNLAKAFKHLLRQDPNVIALGEIRDAQCIQEAMQAALSGHRVFATFHAGSVEETLERIKQMSQVNHLILSGLKGILYLELIHDGDRFVPKVVLSKFNANQLEEIASERIL
jgi:type II secretory ATPase GspE/PulE/Tfp pilus assembly ATPase PilB-like protein